MTDAEAVVATNAGDREAFAALVDRYAGPLAALAFDRLGVAVDAQDAVQEALLAAFNQLEQLREPERFGSWVYGILRRQCATRLRQKGIDRRSVEVLAEARAGREEIPPLERMVEDERQVALRKAVSSLSPVLREVVVLRYLGGIKRKEAAALLDISLDALDKRLERALKELRERMK